MQIPRKPLASAALAAALVPLSACGGTDGAPEEASGPTATADPSPTEKSGLPGLIDALAESTAETDNFTLDAEAVAVDSEAAMSSASNTYEVQGPDLPDRVTATMPTLGELILQSLRMTGQDAGLSAEELSSVTMIVEPDGGSPIISNSHGAFPGGTEWVRGLEGAEAPAPPPLAPGELAPLLEELADEDLITQEGAEKVDGTTATLVEGEAKQAEVEDLGEARETVEGILGGPASGPVAFAVWIDEEGLPVRLETSDDDVEVQLAFSDIGSTSFEAPDPSEVHQL